MGRKVTVGLEADVGKFIGPVEASKKAIDGLDRSVEGLDRDLDKLPADAAKAAAAMKLLGGDIGGVGDKLKVMGDRSTTLPALDAKIRSTRSEVRKLAEEFVRTGDVDVFRKLGGKSGELDVLTGLRKKIVNEMSGAGQEGAHTFAQVFEGGIISAFKALPTEAKAGIIASLVGVVAAAAPLLGATVNAGLLAGVGAGGLAAGIALAAQDPLVRQAWSGLAQTIGSQLKESASPFRAELVQTAGIFRNAFHDLGPSFDRIFARLAPYVSALAAGVAKMAQQAMPGIEKAVEAAGPILQAIADNLPTAGKALDKFFSSLAAGGPGAAAALKFVLVNIEALVVEFGLLFEYLSKAYEGFDKLSRKAAEFFGIDAAQPKSFGRKLTEVKDSADGAAGAFYGLDQKMRDALSTVQRLNQAFDDQIGKTLSLNEANIRAAQAFADLKAGFEGGANALDVNYAKGRNNLRLIDETIEGLRVQRDAEIAAGGGTQEAYDRARAAYNAQIAMLEALVAKLLGSKQAAHEFMSQFYDKTVTVTVKVKVVDPGGAIPGGTRTAFAMAEGGIRKAQTGLIIPPSDPGTVLVGEPQTGGEVLIPRQGITQGRAMDLMQVAGASYGLDVMPRWRSASAAAVPAQVNVASQDLGPLLAEVRGLRGALAGMQIVMDGQRVGAIQGRHADLIRRAG